MIEGWQGAEARSVIKAAQGQTRVSEPIFTFWMSQTAGVHADVSARFLSMDIVILFVV